MTSGDKPRPLDASHVSLFPAPPWQLINKHSASKRSGSEAPRPPTPPPIYRMFGNLYNVDDAILRSLESQGVRRVYPSHNYNRKRELRKINFSILANYLDLLDIITRDPSSPKRAEKLDHLAVLFINMHHLVNEYRQHQARDLLREILIYQTNIALESVEKAEQYLNRAEELLHNAGNELVVPGTAQQRPSMTNLSSSSNYIETIRSGLEELGPSLSPLLRGVLEETISESLPVDRALPPPIGDSDETLDGAGISRCFSADDNAASHLDAALWSFLTEGEDRMDNDGREDIPS